jgi:fibro-slime domain-containing protein
MRKRFFKNWGLKLPLLAGILIASLILACGAALAATAPAGAIGDFTGQYYYFPAPSLSSPNTVAHPDLQRAITGVVTGLVNDNLTGGLPTSTGKVDSSGNKYINDFDWWTSDRLVLTRNDGNLSGIPESNFFPIRPAYAPTVNGNVNGTNVNNYNGYFAVHWTAPLTVTTAGSFGFTMGSDDDSWLFIDGQLVIDNGGVHALNNKSGTKYLTPGNHTIDIFFAERYMVQSGFLFTAAIPPGNGGVESFPVLNATPSYFEQF